jgi:predicted PurR-regulated permease PerM
MLIFLNKHKRTIMIVLAALTIVLGALTAFALYSVRTLFASDKATPTAQQYSEWVGLWLTDDVQNFQAYGEGWQDWLVEARFELPASTLPEFLERNGFVSSESQSLVESSYKLEWFTSTAPLEHYEIKPSPDSAASTSTGFYPSVWLDTADSESVVVYIKANDT